MPAVVEPAVVEPAAAAAQTRRMPRATNPAAVKAAAAKPAALALVAPLLVLLRARRARLLVVARLGALQRSLARTRPEWLAKHCRAGLIARQWANCRHGFKPRALPLILQRRPVRHQRKPRSQTLNRWLAPAAPLIAQILALRRPVVRMAARSMAMAVQAKLSALIQVDLAGMQSPVARVGITRHPLRAKSMIL
ncbi:hypothetical protein ASE82_17440 [Sphingomonas sp. Leaf230]|nr:hypothetical protein ASE82_17440 [Sphingomonas sp. Leaf230]